MASEGLYFSFTHYNVYSNGNQLHAAAKTYIYFSSLHVNPFIGVNHSIEFICFEPKFFLSRAAVGIRSLFLFEASFLIQGLQDVSSHRHHPGAPAFSRQSLGRAFSRKIEE